jgi:flagellar basal-body rod modification protein FlgD
MTQTDATTAVTPTPAPTTAVVNNTPGAQMGKDSFLKLLVAQLQHQDPGSPMDSSAFMSQLAQFSSLEQMTNMSTSIQKLNTSNAVTQSVALIGHDLVFTRPDGSSSSGVADGVTLQNGVVAIDVNGESVSLEAVTAVGPLVSPPTSPTTTPSA